MTDFATWIQNLNRLENALRFLKDTTIEHGPSEEQEQLVHDAAQELDKAAALSLI